MIKVVSSEISRYTGIIKFVCNEIFESVNNNKLDNDLRRKQK